MRYGFVIPRGDISEIVDLAVEAEAAGWDGVFTWDGMAMDPPMPVFDPWVTLGAIAAKTSRVRIGAVLTPPSRRRPWKLARETMTVDRLSGGRLILPLGLGAVDSFGPFGEADDRKTRAELLDETIDILGGLWRGRPFAYEGKHYRFGETTFLPAPVQTPRIPIWVVGAWGRPKSMARALRCDGIMPEFFRPAAPDARYTPDDIRAVAEYVREHRPDPSPFDIVVEGRTPGHDRPAAADETRRFAEAGATWWLEAMWTPPNEVDDVRARIRHGPPAP